ncbi:unnamed protein product [Callosobruchus maculatus]|uniref:Uncharacterized protein n=1 Tax=Callosobruchus maculatus TaxID=64391 RepID=A0A653CCB0_CALMS|nr:unnamed protein product [Callosobruchus maculatus]
MISDDMVVNMFFSCKCRIAIDTRILYRYNATPRFRMKILQMTSKIRRHGSFITTIFTLMDSRRNRCKNRFMIFDDMVIKMYFPCEDRMAMFTRVLFRCNATPIFSMKSRQMTSQVSYICSFITTMFTMMDFRRN